MMGQVGRDRGDAPLLNGVVYLRLGTRRAGSEEDGRGLQREVLSPQMQTAGGTLS